MAIPGFKDFVFPYGGLTGSQYTAPAVAAYGDMVGSLAQSSASQRAAEANAAANKYGAYAGGLGSAFGGYSSGIGSLYGGYSSMLGNNDASASNAYGGLAGGLASLGQSRANAASAKDNAYAGLATGLGGAFSNLYGSQASALQGLANAQSNEATGLANAYAGLQTGRANALANSYGGYSSGLGNIASAMAAQEGARYNSNAMAEAARQAGLANIASSALGAYGSAAGSAMGAFGQAESAYQNARGNIGSGYMNALGNLGSSQLGAMGNVGSANQVGIANLGQSRNNAIGNLGAAYANAGQGLGAAAMAGDLDLSFTDYGTSGYGGAGGFSATGPDGLIASGSIGDYSIPGSGGMSLEATKRTDNSKLDNVVRGTFGGLGSLAQQLDNQQGYNELAGGLGASYNALGRGLHDSQAALSGGFGQAVSGMRPDYGFLSGTLGGTLAGLQGMSRDAYGNTNYGMDQFYGNQAPQQNYSPLVNALTAGYGNAVGGVNLGQDGGIFQRGQYGDYANAINGGAGNAAGRIDGLANAGFNSLRNNRYSDSGLLRGLYSGFDGTMGSLAGSRSLGTIGLANASDLMGAGFSGTADAIRSGYGLDSVRSGDVAGDMLEGLAKQDDEADALKKVYQRSILGKYSQTVRNPETLNPASPLYSPERAAYKAWLESQY